MLDVRITGYVVPLAEQPQASLTPVIAVSNVADEDAVITGVIRIYRESTGLLIYTSRLAVTQLEHMTSTNIAALTPFDPPAPADQDYFIKADLTATSFLPGPPLFVSLGAWHFDIKTPPMGEAPAGHHVTHEDGGSDELVVTGLSGELADDQPVLIHNAAKHTETTPQVLVDQAAISWDLDAGGAAQVTLAGDRTLNAPTNMVDGARYRLKVIQDATGTRLLTWNAAYKFPGAVKPTLTATANAVDVILFISDGTNMLCTGATFDVR